MCDFGSATTEPEPLFWCYVWQNEIFLLPLQDQSKFQNIKYENKQLKIPPYPKRGGKFQNSFFCSLKSAAAVAILAVALPMMMSCGSDSDALPDLTDSVDSIHVTAPAPNPSSPADTLGVNNEMGSGGQL